MPIQIEILPDRVMTVRILSSSSAEEDQSLQAWSQIRDLIETVNVRLHANSLIPGKESL